MSKCHIIEIGGSNCCPKSPTGIHAIRQGWFTYDRTKSQEDNLKAFTNWKRDSKNSDQFCIYCGEAIW